MADHLIATSEIKHLALQYYLEYRENLLKVIDLFIIRINLLLMMLIKLVIFFRLLFLFPRKIRLLII